MIKNGRLHENKIHLPDKFNKNMKKLFTTLFLGISLTFAFQANAQYCGSSQVGSSCGAISSYGFGDYNTFACITRGQEDSLVIPFYMYNQFTVSGVGTVPVYKLQFNTIDSLPCGLCWSTSVSANPRNLPNEFNHDELGCLKIKGLTNNPAGVYQLVMTLNVAITTANDTAFSAVSPIDSRAGGVTLWIKVIDAGTPCPDTVLPANQQHAYCPTGINEVAKTLSNLSIQPNPMANESKVSFNAEISGTLSLKITDMLGKEVYTSSINAKQGLNQTTIQRGNIPVGMYILSVGNGQNNATLKFVIEE